MTTDNEPSRWSAGGQKLAVLALWLALVGIAAGQFDHPAIGVLLFLASAVALVGALLD